MEKEEKKPKLKNISDSDLDVFVNFNSPKADYLKNDVFVELISNKEPIKNPKVVQVPKQEVQQPKVITSKEKLKEALKKIGVGLLIAAAIAVGFKLSEINQDKIMRDMIRYDQYTEWVNKRREIGIQTDISEETYNYFIKNEFDLEAYWEAVEEYEQSKGGKGK